MAYSYDLPVAKNYVDLVNISELEEICSISDDDSVQQEANNRHLTQAIKYLKQEGSNDSPSTFMDRVNRIDETLLGQLAQQGCNFDPKLYRELRALVTNVMSDYDNAIQEQSLDLDSDDDLAKIYTSTAYDDMEALYRGGSSDPESPSPTPAPRVRRMSTAVAPRRTVPEDKMERERQYKYGGPNGENEMWHKDFPAALPFPETLMMAHWESLKIEYDLNRPKDAASMETIVPLEHDQLRPYFELPQYESGSRFKLPHVSEEDHIAIQKLGTVVHLTKAVDKFFETDQTDGGRVNYAPRVFLQKFQVKYQRAPDQYVTPEQIRNSLSSTPTKSRTTNPAPTRSSGQTVYDPLAKDYESKKARATQHAKTAAFRRISNEVRRAESEDELDHSETFSSRPKPAVTNPTTFSTKAKPKPTPPATFSTKPKVTTTRVASHVKIPKKRPGRPRKTPLPAEVIPAKESNPASNKRKHSPGSQPYEITKSSIKKVSRDTKKRKLSEAKSVEFVEAPIVLEDNSEDSNYPASPVRRPARVGSGSKAAAAGKLSKGTKTTGEARVRMTTRSGVSYY